MPPEVPHQGVAERGPVEHGRKVARDFSIVVLGVGREVASQLGELGSLLQADHAVGHRLAGRLLVDLRPGDLLDRPGLGLGQPVHGGQFVQLRPLRVGDDAVGDLAGESKVEFGDDPGRPLVGDLGPRRISARSIPPAGGALSTWTIVVRATR